MARLSEKELRQIGKHVSDLLPPDDGDCERVFKFAREIRQWENKDSGSDDDGEEGEPPKIVRRKRRPKIHIVRTPKPFSAPAAPAAPPIKLYRSYVFRG